MRQLKTSACEIVHAPGHGQPVAQCTGVDGQAMWLLYSSGLVVLPDGQTVAVTQAIADESGQTPGAVDWMHGTLLEDQNVLFVAAADGAMATVDEHGAVAFIGAIDGGLAAAAWTLDQEMLALYSFNGSLLTLSASWAVLSERAAPAHDPAASASLCWRADGQYIVLSSVDNSPGTASHGTRMLRVWTADLTLHGEGRNEDNTSVPSLSCHTSWSPNGALIACGQTLGKEVRVVFFERNGLRHRELVCPGVTGDSHTVAGIAWNAASDLLAVALQPLSQAVGPAVLQLWHRDNYCWQTQQTLQWADALPAVLSWHSQETPYTLSVTLASAQPLHGASVRVVTLHMAWQASTSSGPAVTASAIQWNRLHLTPLSAVRVPGPACYARIAAASPIVAACFEPSSSGTAQLDGTLPITGDSRVALLCACDELVIAPSALHLPGTRPARAGRRVAWPADASASGCQEDRDTTPRLRLPAAQPVQAADSVWGSAWAGCARVALPEVDGRALRAAEVGPCVWLSATVQAHGARYVLALVVPTSRGWGQAAGQDRVALITVDVPRAQQGSPAPPAEVRARALELPRGASPGAVQVCAMTQYQAGCAAVQTRDGLVHVLSSAGEWQRAVASIPEPCDTLLPLRLPVPCDTSRSAERYDQQDGGEARLGDSDAASVGAASAGSEPSAQHAVCAASDEPAMCAAYSSTSLALYVNSVLVCPTATSAILHRLSSTVRHLVYTTPGPVARLNFVSAHTIAGLVQSARVGPSGGQQPGEDAVVLPLGQSSAVVESASYDTAAGRSVERGAWLVAAVPGTDTVVTRIPRGNLEVVYPRVLTLATLRAAMDQRLWAQALEAMRTRRVDLNYVIDHDPEGFAAWLPAAVQQLPQSDRWDVLVAGIHDVDVAAERYAAPPYYVRPSPAALPPAEQPTAAALPDMPDARAVDGTSSKRNRWCAYIRRAILAAEPGLQHWVGMPSRPSPVRHPQLLMPVLSSLARQDPPALKPALHTVQRLAQPPAEGADGSAPMSAAAALRHLALLADKEALWRVALGTYDLDLAAMVADATARDPRDFAPRLHLIMRMAGVHHAAAAYVADATLQRWDAALIQLLALAQSASALLAEDLHQATVGDALPAGHDGVVAGLPAHPGELVPDAWYDEEAAAVWRAAGAAAIGAWPREGGEHTTATPAAASPFRWSAEPGALWSVLASPLAALLALAEAQGLWSQLCAAVDSAQWPTLHRVASLGAARAVELQEAAKAAQAYLQLRPPALGPAIALCTEQPALPLHTTAVTPVPAPAMHGSAPAWLKGWVSSVPAGGLQAGELGAALIPLSGWLAADQVRQMRALAHAHVDAAVSQSQAVGRIRVVNASGHAQGRGMQHDALAWLHAADVEKGELYRYPSVWSLAGVGSAPHEARTEYYNLASRGAQLLAHAGDDVDTAVAVLCGVLGAASSGTADDAGAAGLFDAEEDEWGDDAMDEEGELDVSTATVSPAPRLGAALALAASHERGDLLETVILPAAVFLLQHWTSLLQTQAAELREAARALASVRASRAAMDAEEAFPEWAARAAAAAAAAGDPDFDMDLGDGASTLWTDATSVAGSVASRASRASRSSRVSAASDASDLFSVASDASSVASTSSLYSTGKGGRFSGVTATSLRAAGRWDQGAQVSRAEQEEELHRRARRRAEKQQRKKRVAPNSVQDEARKEHALLQALPDTGLSCDMAELLAGCNAVAGATAVRAAARGKTAQRARQASARSTAQLDQAGAALHAALCSLTQATREAAAVPARRVPPDAKLEDEIEVEGGIQYVPYVGAKVLQTGAAVSLRSTVDVHQVATAALATVLSVASDTR